MIIFADMHAIKHTLNSKTEAHSYPLWTVGERANIVKSSLTNKCRYTRTLHKWEQEMYTLYCYCKNNGKHVLCTAKYNMGLPVKYWFVYYCTVGYNLPY